MERVSWPARLESLPLVQEYVETLAQRSGIHGKRLIQLSVALEEVVVNIINHAYDQTGRGDILVGFDDQAETVVISLVDRGLAFNPLEATEPNVEMGLLDRPIGGLGIMMVKKFMDKVRYERHGNENILYLTLNKNV
ncbi:MAG: ATP-binding protein [Desulfobacterium sp.]|nr:ATP-binding protein [Desulfobacterium sp.]